MAGPARSKAEAVALARLRKLCLSLPEATEKVAWGELTWRLKGKLFAQMDDHHHGGEHCSVWLPAEMGAQEALVETHPRHFFRPPYVGHKGWVGVHLDTKLEWGVIEGLVRQAWAVVASPKLLAQLDAPKPARRATAARKPRRR
jgi:hypothetical protein